MSAAPAKREDDAHLRLKSALQRRLFKDKVPYFPANPKKRPYPSQKTPPRGY